MDSNTPLVSVIIPLYNYEKYIEASVNSVINQTYKHLQIIVVNDGSTDNSLEVANKIKDDRLLVINSEKNQGNSKTLNIGLQHAKGAYIKYLDADDMMNPVHIEEQLKLIIGKDDEVASCKWGRFTNDISDITFDPDSTWKSMDSMTWIKTALSQKAEMTGGCIWLIPKNIIDKAGPWNETLSINNDYEYSVRILMASKKVNFSAHSMIYYRDTPNSVSKQNGYKRYKALYESAKLASTTLLEAEDSLQMRRLIANRFQFILYNLYPLGKKLQSTIVYEIKQLGGSDLKYEASGKLNALNRILGWKAARRWQYIYYKFRYNIN